jgi:hypothetical protein
MRYLYLVCIFSSFYAAAQVNHWESVVLPGDQWQYLVPTSQPNSNWNQVQFNSSSWSTGASGFGNGDADDATILPSLISVYIRSTFTIKDASVVEAMVLDLDYDDGFVAYLNGQEIARNLVSGSVPNFDQPSDGSHEALLYQGFAPERFTVDTALLTTGTNVIAVQVHNQSIFSSDLTVIPTLSLGVNTSDYDYRTPPSWFETPTPSVDVNFESSNLPIVVINTEQGQEIPDDPKINATMKIIYNPDGQRNFLTDINNASALSYDGSIKIEYRGSSSSLLDKKQYAFTPYDDQGEKVNVSFLEMPKENDWILNGLAYDPSFMRDYLSYKLSNLTGNYASRGRYCEVVLNGDFRGIYVLQEKLKADDSRIDINKIKETDLSFPKLTGGYITKADKNEGSDTPAWYMDSYGWGQVNYIHEHPKPTTVKFQQNEYIKNEFEKLEVSASQGNSSITSGYPSVIDIPSFVDFMILNEFASNADGYQFSTFFHKDRNGKLRAGPIWDFNLTFGNDLFDFGFDRSKTYLWQFEYENMGTKFWTDLFNDSVFKCYLTKRWKELIAPGMPLNSNAISNLIDTTKTLISEAATRQELLSGTTGQFEDQISGLKSFIFERISWISGQLSDTSLCDNVSTPPLVISKINYHPLVQEDQDSSDFEFIEIINNGASSVNLTGIYFGGLGLTYQFSPGASIAGNKSIYLAKKSESFKERYGFEPFGEFSRSLSNDGEDLVLLDAYGNVIDEVIYNDVLPWSEEADGDGAFLQLSGLGLDNSLASNWTAINDIAGNLSVNSVQVEPYVVLSPNPVSDLLTLKISLGEIHNVKLYSLNGKLVKTYTFNQSNVEVDLSAFENGLYLLQIQTNTNLLHKKIIKI